MWQGELQAWLQSDLIVMECGFWDWTYMLAIYIYIENILHYSSIDKEEKYLNPCQPVKREGRYLLLMDMDISMDISVI